MLKFKVTICDDHAMFARIKEGESERVHYFGEQRCELAVDSMMLGCIVECAAQSGKEVIVHGFDTDAFCDGQEATKEVLKCFVPEVETEDM